MLKTIYSRVINMKTFLKLIVCLSFFTACSNSDDPVESVAPKYKRCIIIGNSLTIHGITDFWWGCWGMAASKEENDFVHRLQSKVREHNPYFVCHGINITEWERSLDIKSINLEKLDHIMYNFQESVSIKDYDLIIIRLGENIKYTDINDCEEWFTSLVEGIHSINNTASVFITGVFWTDPVKDAAIKNVAQKYNLKYINIDKICTSENMESLGNPVWGNDGEIHYIDYEAVAMHPNDSGMEAIAEAIYQAIGPF